VAIHIVEMNLDASNPAGEARQRVLDDQLHTLRQVFRPGDVIVGIHEYLHGRILTGLFPA
jgi:hypothetical protein